MARFIKKVSAKAGLPPGTLVHIGERMAEKVAVTLIDYDSDHIEEREIIDVNECLPFKDTSTISWINVAGLHDTELVESLGSCFGLHPLHLEDILNTGGRPKIEDYDDYILVVLKMLYLTDDSDEIAAEHLSLVIGKNYVISFQEEYGDVFDRVRKLIRNGKGRIKREGADYLAYLLIDAVVDNYFNVMETVGEAIEDMEEVVMGRPGRETIHVIHKLKSDLIFLRKSIHPLREVISDLERGESDLIRQTTEVHFRDVYDHVIQVMDTLDTYRDILSNMMDAYLSSLSNRMNEIVKVLTIFSTIFIPLTFLAGVYGMNFRYLPELRWHWAYPVFWLVSIALAGMMLAVFKKKKWL